MVVGLLLINLLLILFLLLGKGHGPHRQPKEIIIERLHFDDEQVGAYLKLIHYHRSTVDALDDSIAGIKKGLYSSLSTQPVTADSLQTVTSRIAALQQQIENTHYRHFADIKALCRPDQLKDFEDLSQDLARIFSPPKPHRRPE